MYIKFGPTPKSVSTVFIEAFVVAIVLTLTFLVLKKLHKYIPKITSNTILDTAFIAGFIIHVVFEYSGINQWYSLDYCQIINTAKLPSHSI